jgi:uncharacterized protein YbjT (DUF2867 family)
MMSVVTGAFGYIGKSIARQLTDQGEEVRTITTHITRPNPWGDRVGVYPYDFSHPDLLIEHMRGANTLYNSYWIRFEHAGMTFAQAVKNTATLFDCARKAGVPKVVHISVTHASPDSPLPYYAGKAAQERALEESGLNYAILRPTLVFGPGDILVNNIAWLMRNFPVFPIFGSGEYRLQPVFVEDLAALAIEASGHPISTTDDIIGPEEFTFEGFTRLIASQVRPGLPLVHVPPCAGIVAGRVIGWGVGDVMLTRDELRGLMDEMLTSEAAPAGSTRFSDWLAEHRNSLGRRYASELARHFTPAVPSAAES